MSLFNSAFSTKFVESRKTYNKLGQFDYKGEEYTKNLKERIDENKVENEWIYIGQFKEEIMARDGIGIWVCGAGATLNN